MPYEVPDPDIYCVEDHPQLVKTQRALEAKGLHDPWLRNEVWRYDPCEFGTFTGRVNAFLLRGFRVGLVATVATLIATPIFKMVFPTHHGHHSHIIEEEDEEGEEEEKKKKEKTDGKKKS